MESKPGRPLKVTDAVLEQARELVAKGSTVNEAAAALGVGKSQLYAGLRVSDGGTAGGVAKVAPASSPVKLPQGGEVSDRPDLLPLVYRILDARDPAARRELEEGLAMFTRGGDEALAVWLARPAVSAPADDPLVELLSALGRLKTQVESLPPGHARAASTAQALATLAKGAEQIRKGRPEPETVDQLVARLSALDVETWELIEGYTVAREEQAARPEPGMPHGRCVTCGMPLEHPLDAPPMLPPLEVPAS